MMDDRSPIRLLVVNERPEIVESITRFLSQFQQVSVVGTAHGMEDSLARARELHPLAVLCDYSHLKQETLERIRRLRAELPAACIIAMSYDEEQTDVVLQAGADQFISKFELSRHLMPALEQCATSLR
jgi:two-component system, OmpR family, response regulator